MLRKSKNLIPYNLLPLLVILFISVGMPLVHPALHNHFDHEHVSEDHGAEHLPPKPDEDKAHECPICDFLATCQLHPAGLGPMITASEWMVRIDTINQIFLVKACPFPAKSRAPPAFVSL